MSLLTVVQDVCREIGVAVPTSVVGSSDLTAVQLLAIAKTGLEKLAEEHHWQRLTVAHTFVAFASATASSVSLPSDYDRMINGTWYDDTNNRPMRGPIGPQEWKELRKGTLSGGAGLDTAFRIFGNAFHLHPIETSGSTVFGFDYISTNLAESSGGTAKATFAADNDVPRFDEKLVKRDMIWRFRKAKGLPYADELLEFQDSLDRAIARDGARPTKSAQGRTYTAGVNIPETDFPAS